MLSKRHFLNLLLFFPPLLLAWLSFWIVGKEKSRIELEQRDQALSWGREVLRTLNQDGNPARHGIENKVAVHVPFQKTPPFHPTDLEKTFRDLQKQNSESKLNSLDALLVHPRLSQTLTTSGLPLILLVLRQKLTLAPEDSQSAIAEQLRHQVLRHPSELSQLLLKDAHTHLTHENLLQDLRIATLQQTALAKLDTEPPPVAPGGQHFSWPSDSVLAQNHGTLISIFPDWLIAQEASARIRSITRRPTWLALDWPRDSLLWRGHPLPFENEPNKTSPPKTLLLATPADNSFQVLVRADQTLLRQQTNVHIARLKIALAIATLATGLASLFTFFSIRKQQRLAALQSDFVASVSHELRTPVASIGLLAARLETETVPPAKASQYHRFISREGQRLATLIENILDFSRIEKGLKHYHFEATDLPSLLSETIELIRPRAEEKDLILTQQIDFPQGFSPSLDAFAIRQLLLNILDNAIKYTPAQGTIHLTASTSKNCIHITLADTGPGIPESDRKKVFQRFYRREQNTEIAGAGIGLNLVKHIAEAHHGTATIDSNPGGGAKVLVTLQA